MSISKLFLAGIVPGILIGVGLAIAWWWEVAAGAHRPAADGRRTREVIRALVDGAWALALPGIIIFGLKFGIFTPTEAAVVCAVYALFVAIFIYKELKWKDVYGVFVAAARDDGRRDVPRRRGARVGVADHGRRAARRRSWRCSSPSWGTRPMLLMIAMMAAGRDRRHGARHDADDPDPDAGADADRQAGGHRPDLLRRAVHHQQLDRPDHAAGRHRAQRRLRRRQGQDGRHHQGRVAVHDRAAGRAAAADRLSRGWSPGRRDGSAARRIRIRGPAIGRRAGRTVQFCSTRREANEEVDRMVAGSRLRRGHRGRRGPGAGATSRRSVRRRRTRRGTRSGRRMEKFAELVAAEERRQDAGQAVPGRRCSAATCRCCRRCRAARST